LESLQANAQNMRFFFSCVFVNFKKLRKVKSAIIIRYFFSSLISSKFCLKNSFFFVFSNWNRRQIKIVRNNHSLIVLVKLNSVQIEMSDRRICPSVFYLKKYLLVYVKRNPFFFLWLCLLESLYFILWNNNEF